MEQSRERSSAILYTSVYSMSCWLVSRSFLFLLSQCTIQTPLRLNEQQRQSKILVPFVYFELTLICISTSRIDSSAAHAHSHSRVRRHVMCLTCHPLCNREKCKQPKGSCFCEKVPHTYPAHEHHIVAIEKGAFRLPLTTIANFS